MCAKGKPRKEGKGRIPEIHSIFTSLQKKTRQVVSICEGDFIYLDTVGHFVFSMNEILICILQLKDSYAQKNVFKIVMKSFTVSNITSFFVTELRPDDKVVTLQNGNSFSKPVSRECDNVL